MRRRPLFPLQFLPELLAAVWVTADAALLAAAAAAEVSVLGSVNQFSHTDFCLIQSIISSNWRCPEVKPSKKKNIAGAGMISDLWDLILPIAEWRSKSCVVAMMQKCKNVLNSSLFWKEWCVYSLHLSGFFLWDCIYSSCQMKWTLSTAYRCELSVSDGIPHCFLAGEARGMYHRNSRISGCNNKLQ